VVEFFGDTIVVDYYGQRSQYIATGLNDEIYEVYQASADNGMLLQIDSIMYKMRSWHQGDDFQLDDGCLYLGEIQSSVPEDQRPEKDFQVNNTYDFMIGAKVYKLPPGGEPEHIISNSHVVIIDDENRLYYAPSSR